MLGWLAPVVLPASASAQQKAEARSGALYVVTYIDVFPNFTDDTMKALRQFATDTVLRQEWQNSLALRKPEKGTEGKFGGRAGEAATRTQVLAMPSTGAQHAPEYFRVFQDR
jgi:hypothetical protein